ncbi:MAG: uracil phosphoribosyltransferase [Flavobacteriaceae bacterium]|nr:uracil phosphoribosyltransferase [Flavobacteriaceae bacterium]|tara:strand:+ start:482655 stop:483308 length:654 start_codon:yes stop_codon:yes gene_type:complete
MIVHNLEKQATVLNAFLSQIRDESVQKDRLRFRKNIERIGEIIAFELSKSLSFEDAEIQTPLGAKQMLLPQDDLVICSVLRAGIPLHNGLLNYFDDAGSAFISAYRKHKDNSDDFEIVVEYFASPDLNGKTLILADPMLATGQSLVAVSKALQKYGRPKRIFIASVIASEAGIAYVQKHFPEDTILLVASVDSELNSKGYIIPGLGDAGDLAFGPKL